MSLVRLRVPLGFLVGIAYAVMARPTLTSLLIAVPLVVLGETLRITASGNIEKNRRLTTWGPYRHLRHPLYVGSALLTAGFALASARLEVGLLLVVLFALVYRPVSRSEERALEEKFGDAYREFAAAVPAYLPRLRGWTGGQESGAFSWAGVRRHREYQAVLGAASLFAWLLYRVFSLAPLGRGSG